MIDTLKSKLKKIIFTLSGRFDHLKTGVAITKKWYGNKYGGFFVAPESLNNKSIVYSFGIGEDISFDEAIIKHHNCTVFGFDPTPKSIKWINDQGNKIPASFKFIKYGIGAKSGPMKFFLPKNSQHVSGSIINQVNVDDKHAIDVTIKSLDDIASELGHEKISVLKMDIEGAEYDVISSILKSRLQIDQILIEFHERFFDDGKNRTSIAVSELKKYGYEIFGISDSFDEVSFKKITS